jgi:hypothetical protein
MTYQLQWRWERFRIAQITGWTYDVIDKMSIQDRNDFWMFREVERIHDTDNKLDWKR